MEKILLLTRRELSAYFVSPIAYVAMALFLLLAGVFFAFPWFGAFRPGQPAQMQYVFSVMTFVLMLVVPALTMRSLAEERGSGTIETLLTAPVTDLEVVLAKFLGCWLFYLGMLAPTLLYAVALAVFGNPDFGPIVGGYVGLALLGAMYVAVGVLASSLTRAQVIAFVVAFFPLLVLWVLGPIGGSLPSPWRTILREAGTLAHYEDFNRGVIAAVHVAYFVTVTVYALFLTVKVLESRRWR
ncbi:MAG: ABC transporter permease [Planctomycetes bacterium]|nr:ABC transporter permease [Planctomycetota bacterium]